MSAPEGSETETHDRLPEDVVRAGVGHGEQEREDELAADRDRVGAAQGSGPTENLRDGDPSVVDEQARGEEQDAALGDER